MNSMFMYLLAQKRGGGGSGGGGFATGTYTAADDVQASLVVVEHSLGVIPQKLFWIITAPTTSGVSGTRPLFCLYSDKNGTSYVSNSSTGSSFKGKVSEYNIDKINKTVDTIYLCEGGFISAGNIPAGCTVTWFVFGE